MVRALPPEQPERPHCLVFMRNIRASRCIFQPARPISTCWFFVFFFAAKQGTLKCIPWPWWSACADWLQCLPYRLLSDIWIIANSPPLPTFCHACRWMNHCLQKVMCHDLAKWISENICYLWISSEVQKQTGIHKQTQAHSDEQSSITHTLHWILVHKHVCSLS